LPDLRNGGGTPRRPAFDYTNEVQVPPGRRAEVNIDGNLSIPSAPETPSGKTIADQLAAHGLSWKSYQESLPPTVRMASTSATAFSSDSSNIPDAIPGEAQSVDQVVCREAPTPLCTSRAFKKATIRI